MDILPYDGQISRSWEEVATQLNDTCHEFGIILLKSASLSANSISTNLINTGSISRFKGLVGIVSDSIKNGLLYEVGLVPPEKEEAIRLNCWILLGSLTESSLQMFLSIYASDYQDSKWQQWSELNHNEVKNAVLGCVNELVTSGKLNASQGRSLKSAVKDTIKEHTNEHLIETVMLDELIQFYSKMEILESNDLTHLRTIQVNRNGIHSFQARKLGSWDDLKTEIQFFCHLLRWIIVSIPDITEC